MTFRTLDARDLAAYVSSGEWEGRAGAYAIQGLGAALVERIEGDYLNVVGLPAALLVRLLAHAFPGRTASADHDVARGRDPRPWLEESRRPRSCVRRARMHGRSGARARSRPNCA